MTAAYILMAVGAGIVFGILGALATMLLQGKDLRQ